MSRLRSARLQFALACALFGLILLTLVVAALLIDPLGASTIP